MIIKSAKLYDAIKWVALVGLPGLGTLYVALGAIWSFDNTQAVSGTILAVDTFLGGLIHLSSSSFKASDDSHDGSIDLVNSGGTPTYAISLKGNDPDALLASKDTVTLKVNAPSVPMPIQLGPAASENQNPGGTNANGF
jgi:Putative phage holin Dp-1